jgi:signal transduction histidine kinase
LLLNEAKKREELKVSGNQRLLLISVIFFVIILTAILYWLYVKSKHSRILGLQNAKVTGAFRELKQLMDQVEYQNRILEEKNDALEDLHREKDGLIGIVAHDLRAPLNRISGLLRLLTYNRDLSDNDKEIVSVIEKVCHDGNGLIRDLLDINQYESAQSVEMSRIELAAHVQSLLSHYTQSLEKKNLKLFFHHEGDTSVSTSTNYLDRILDNVVTNAIKFSPVSRDIYVKVLGRESTVLIVVEDRGQGFHPDDLPHLFRKFKKLSARPTAGESSTGLGLSIVKTLAEKIGGSVTIDSEWGKGARVTIVIPLDAVSEPVVVAE